MKRPAPTAFASSVRDRLKVIADRRREDFQDVLLRFGVERLLYRLCRSEWRDRFVLKGRCSSPSGPTGRIELRETWTF